MAGLTLGEKVRSSDIQKDHGVGQLLLCSENQFRSIMLEVQYIGHLIRTPPTWRTLQQYAGESLIWLGNALGSTKKDLEDMEKEKDI